MDEFAAAPSGLDLREASHLDYARRTAEEFLVDRPSLRELDQLEAQLLARRDEVPLGVHLAGKLARSRRMVEELDRERQQEGGPQRKITVVSVSYTHLTLPTMRLRCRSRWSPYH